MKKDLKFYEKVADSKLGRFVDDIKLGWNSYNFIFYIGGVAAILGSIFGLAGWAATIVTVLFFYYAGKFKRKLDLEKKRREKEKEEKEETSS